MYRILFRYFYIKPYFPLHSLDNYFLIFHFFYCRIRSSSYKEKAFTAIQGIPFKTLVFPDDISLKIKIFKNVYFKCAGTMTFLQYIFKHSLKIFCGWLSLKAHGIAIYYF